MSLRFPLMLLSFVMILGGCSANAKKNSVTSSGEFVESDLTNSPDPNESEVHRVTFPGNARYIFIGFPLDLVDVPFTCLRRLGFADLDTGVNDEDPATPLTIFASTGVGGVGAVALAGALGVAFPFSLLAVIPGAIVGLVAGMNISFVIGHIGYFIKEQFQVPLLRSGYDSEEYFPNWRYVLHDEPLPENSDT